MFEPAERQISACIAKRPAMRICRCRTPPARASRKARRKVAGGGDSAHSGFAHHVPAFTLAVFSAVAAVTIAKRRVWVRDRAPVVVLAAVIFSLYAPSGSRSFLI